MVDTSKVRRVLIDDFVMEGYDDYGNWAEDRNGTHVLVEREVWERVVNALRANDIVRLREKMQRKDSVIHEQGLCIDEQQKNIEALKDEIREFEPERFGADDE